jgi:hypothetical protein
VEVKYFQLGSIKIPSDIENRYIQALVLQEQAEEELLKQATLRCKSKDWLPWKHDNMSKWSDMSTSGLVTDGIATDMSLSYKKMGINGNRCLINQKMGNNRKKYHQSLLLHLSVACLAEKQRMLFL